LGIPFVKVQAHHKLNNQNAKLKKRKLKKYPLSDLEGASEGARQDETVRNGKQVRITISAIGNRLLIIISDKSQEMITAIMIPNKTCEANSV
jgi:hypothetical protein